MSRSAKLALWLVALSPACLGAQAIGPGFELERSLAGQWSSIEDALYRALESRAEEVTTGLDRRLHERAEFEANGIPIPPGGLMACAYMRGQAAGRRRAAGR